MVKTDIEIALQKQLDLELDNHFIRSILADHLEEIDDKRAFGYRWLANNKIIPYKGTVDAEKFYSYFNYGLFLAVHGNCNNMYKCNSLPLKVINLLKGTFNRYWCYFNEREEAEDETIIAVLRIFYGNS